MQKKLTLAVLALCSSSIMVAQNTKTETNQQEQTANAMDESAFTFTEAQLGEDNDMNDNVTILNSNSNVYASQVGFLYSPMRFRYRALNQKYNDIYINGAPMNDMKVGSSSILWLAVSTNKHATLTSPYLLRIIISQ